MSGNIAESSAASRDIGQSDPWGFFTVRDVEVAPDKVAEAAKVIEGQADALQRVLDEHEPALSVAPPAQDIVSTHAVQAWKAVIVDNPDSYAARVRAYVAGLRDLAARLRSAHSAYSENEEDNTAALGNLDAGR